MGKTPIGILQNNPTNIRKNLLAPWMGEEQHQKNGFCQFVNRTFCYRATFLIFHSYVNNHGLRTLRDCIERWAPRTENDTGRYVRFVSNSSSYPEAVSIDLANEDMMCRIVQAMAKMECGLDENIETIRKGYRLACVSQNMRNVKER